MTMATALRGCVARTGLALKAIGGNRIFRRVIAALSETMNRRGDNVGDETAVAMGFTQPNRVRRRDARIAAVRAA